MCLIYAYLLGRILSIFRLVKAPKIGTRNKNNVCFWLCCDGNGHFTQFMELTHQINKKKKVNCVFINSNPHTVIPSYLTEFCESNNITIEYFNGTSLNECFSGGKINYLKVFLFSVLNIPNLLLRLNHIIRTLNKHQCATIYRISYKHHY